MLLTVDNPLAIQQGVLSGEVGYAGGWWAADAGVVSVEVVPVQEFWEGDASICF